MCERQTESGGDSESDSKGREQARESERQTDRRADRQADRQTEREQMLRDINYEAVIVCDCSEVMPLATITSLSSHGLNKLN